MSCNKCDTTEECGCKQEALHISQICNPVICETEECSETFNASCIIYTGDDIICNEVILGTSGENIAQMVSNITAYFCSTEGVPDAISCGTDIVVPQDTTFADALPLIVDYFCTAIGNIAALTETTVSAVDAVGVDGCVVRTYTITFLSGVTILDTVQFSTPSICPPEDYCGKPTVPTPEDTDDFLICREVFPGNTDVRKLSYGAITTAIQLLIDNSINNIPGNILSAYNSATGAGNLAGASTMNAIVVSIPGNTLANDGDEYEMDLYTEYGENDPVDLEIGIGAGATWTKTIQSASNDKSFFKVKVARIDQNNQMWTIEMVTEDEFNTRYVAELDVIYTTKDLSTTENWTVNLINSGAAAANALVLHKAVLKLNKV
jgi:hypothetical protein